MAAKQPSRISGTVLIADDHSVFRFGLVSLLHHNFGVGKCLEAQRLSEAVAHLSDDSIQLAIFDLDMPGLKSAHELAEIRHMRPDMRLVVISGSSDRADILAALQAGVHGYIVKTEGMSGIIDHLSYIMSGQVYVPPLIAEMSVETDSPKIVAPATTDQQQDYPLTQRQRQVLHGLVHGMTNKEIARKLDLAEGTVKMHVGALLRALGATNRAHAAAIGKGLLG
ncbi:MAG: response regulator [Hyphomicrobiaceae bacterium]